MKTAVLISGQMRTFTRCYSTQRWQIFRHYEPDIHFFVSCVDNEQSNSTSLLLKDYENVHCEQYRDPIDLPVIADEKGVHAPYTNAASHDKLMLQHWGNKRVWQFFWGKMGGGFDTIIRLRPDQWIHRFQSPPAPFENECYCPWWGKFGGINDRLAIMGETAAFCYFEAYNLIDELLASGCPFHPESLLAASLERGKAIVHNTLMAEMSTERMDGSRRWPEIGMSDIAELINECGRKS